MTPPALLFDLDGTLVDSACDIARALTIVSEERGGGVIDPQLVRPLVSQGATTLVMTALGEVAQTPAVDLAEFRRVLATLPVDPTTIYPGVEAALTALRDAGHPMAIVTNKPEGLARVLMRALALDRFFGAIVGGDTTDFAKPHRAPLDHALDALGARADNALFIGDSDIDAAAAFGYGMPFLLYTGGYGALACDVQAVARRFDHFDPLPALISALLQDRSAGGVP